MSAALRFPSPAAPAAPAARAPYSRFRRSATALAVLISVGSHILAAGAATVLLPRFFVERDPGVAIEVDLASAAAVELEPIQAAPATTPAMTNHPTMLRRSPTARARPPAIPGAAGAEMAPKETAPTTHEVQLRFSLTHGSVGTVAVGAAAPANPRSTFDGTRVGSADEPIDSEEQVNVPAQAGGMITPTYPEEARRAEVEADVVLEILVDTDGYVREARSLNRRGYGLDEAALAAIRACRFSPALRDGRPVRVRMRWTVQFRLTR